MTSSPKRGERGLAGAFGTPPKRQRARPSETAAAKPKPPPRGEAKAPVPSPPEGSQQNKAGAQQNKAGKSAGGAIRPQKRVLPAPVAVGKRSRRSVRVPMSYLRRCAILRGHLGLSQGDILMGAYVEQASAMIDDPETFVEQWSRRRDPLDPSGDGRENLQPLLTDEERQALQELVDLTAPAGTWPKVVAELLDRHLPSLERHVSEP